MADNMLPSLSYTTPEEFVNYYYEQLKTDLGVYDLQISKVGFIGFFMNLLGYTHFDLKQYYDSLFKEAFVGTAQTEESQYLHAATYGYVPSFATASTATGTIEFNMLDYLTSRQSDVVRREVILGYSYDSGVYESQPAKFFMGNIQFTINAIYKFVEIKENGSYYYYADIITSDGSKYTFTTSTPNISVPLYSTTQYVQKEINMTLKPYNFGSYQTYYFSLDAGYYLSNLQVFVTKINSAVEEEFNVKYTKYLERGDSNSVFLRKITSTDYVIEFGSGIRGTWISEASVRLVIKTTRGVAGNLIDTTNLKVNIGGTILAFDYKYDTTGALVPLPAPKIMSKPLINFSYSEGGIDPKSGEDLRDEIVNYIQTRDNMVSRQDFYNIATTYFNDFKFLFKKYNVYDNIFHLCRAYRNRNQTICYTTNHCVEVMDLYATKDTSFTINADHTYVPGGNLTEGLYSYFVVGVDEWGQTTPSIVVFATVRSIEQGYTDNAVIINWTAIPNAISYRVYGRSSTVRDRYWSVTNLTFTDDGNNAGTIIPVAPNTYILREINYRPEFNINGETFISPFIYKENNRMGYYEGYIMKDLSRIDFTNVTPEPATLGTGFDVPTVYLNLDYDDQSYTTTIRLKSYQDISSIIFYISIYGTESSIADKRMEYDSVNNEFTYVYNNSETFGIFEGSIQIEVKGGISNSVVTNEYETFALTSETNTLQLAFNTQSPVTFTDIILPIGPEITATEIITTINNAIGSTVASEYIDNDGNIKIQITPPPGDNLYNAFIGTASTCLSVLGLIGNDTDTATLNGPIGNITTASGTVIGLKFTSTTSTFYQLINISDQLKLIRYKTSSATYVVNIPVMYKITFDTDPDYYLDKVKNFIVGTSFSENRMITDEIQCRFLNTYSIPSPFIEAVFLQGGEIFSAPHFHYLTPVTLTLNEPPTDALLNQRIRVGTSPVVGSVFDGRANNIATYKLVNGSLNWEFYDPNDYYVPNVYEDFVLDESTNIYYKWDIDHWVWASIPTIKLPFRMTIQIKADKTYVQKNNIDLVLEKNNIMLNVAEYLQKGFTGSSVVFYNSLMIEFVHTGRNYIKSVKIFVTDSSDIPNELNNGIEILDETKILEKLTNKLDIVKYVPILAYWDVDNLNIEITVE